MTTKEIEDELHRMLSDVVNGGYPKRTYAQQARYKEAVKRTIDALDVLEQMSNSEKANKWIPLTKRPMTEDEREEYKEMTGITERMIFDCPLPDDGEEVLVCYGSYVYMDIFHNDDNCYFEEVDINEAEAWMPLPLPYKAERDDESCDDIWEKAYKEREGKKMNGSFELTFNNPLTEEDWDKIRDVELENTPTVTFKTPKGKQVKYIKSDILDKIRAEIQRLRGCSCSCSDGIIDDVEDILDKYKAESEDKND